MIGSKEPHAKAQSSPKQCGDSRSVAVQRGLAVMHGSSFVGQDERPLADMASALREDFG
jgi:hypothetical protein